MGVAIVIGLSIVLQLTASGLALRLIRLTGRNRAWVLIAIAITLMALRRYLSLAQLLAGETESPPNLVAEGIALSISLLMVAGVAAIAPLFRAIKEAEQSQQESEEQFRNLIEGSIQGVLIHRRMQPLFVNQAWAAIHGMSREEVLQMETIMPLIAPHERPRMMDYYEERLQGREAPNEYEYQGQRQDGTLIWLDNKGTVVRWAGEPAVQSAIFDITERKQIAEQLAQHNQVLEQAVQEKTRDMAEMMARLMRYERLVAIGHLAGNIAHELRNPLGAVKQSLFFLNRLRTRGSLDMTNPKVPEHLQLMDTEIDNANRVITQLLATARTEPHQPQLLDVCTVLHEAVRHCRWGEGMHLIITCDPDPCMMWADRWQMRHIFMNLLNNAADACDQQGQVTIAAHILPDTQQCHITVQDTGCGIAADDIKHVFEPLYSQKTLGTGLGLSLSKQLIEHHGGRITLCSQVGHGTTVDILLPSRPLTETHIVEQEDHDLDPLDSDRG